MTTAFMGYLASTLGREAPVYTTVSKWGDGLGIPIPLEITRDARIEEGTVIDIRVEAGRIIVEPSEGETLDLLLARVTPENCHREQLRDLPISREAW